MTELIVVGNGFDRHHCLETSYGSFAQFAKKNSPVVYDALSGLFLASSEYMGFDSADGEDAQNFIYKRWSDFEASLGLLDDEEFVQRSSEDVSEYMQELGMGEQLVEEFVQHIASVLDIFRDWVASVEIPISHRRDFSFRPAVRFVNFNYTETLETYYGVNPANIFYIHGSRVKEDKLIVGHGTNPPEPRSKHDLPDIQFNPFYGYLRLTRKPVEVIEPMLRQWLAEIPEVEKISVRGHSLGSVDLPYFETIKKIHPYAHWSFSYFNDEDLNSIQLVMRNLKLNRDDVFSVATLGEFEANPDSRSNAICMERA
ncbi:bacteriophage abortive infection AbiH family protein (plasmid) [Agrobacterium tumefaciens]|uniref:bacteriophage abortive infection AbiH family protein n=1 Tax=Agrobacterium tumefaciens TaxID=358 RepID=UPI0015737C36|nr:bacteriophage abortive infection AbiH family protein [Agrobacterium tumefaciens]NSZ66893.1 hypothetical protein [Agrobacterium tumefaciens]NTA73091.1 hypothetical protein [Agrobacterium tumefaciens]WIE41630.1 bacteriophage abortive infection AbiH family protein [Agrobacterium tumefaciens]